MDIYIYGTSSFKNKLHSVLDHGNVRFKISDGQIYDIVSLDNLKDQIKQSPSDIYLIDQSKIIYDDLITKYFKFLIPKDGISKKFLDLYGIGDISLRDFDDLIIYIDKRLEAIENAKPKPHEITQIDEMMEEDTLEAIQSVTENVKE